METKTQQYPFEDLISENKISVSDLPEKTQKRIAKHKEDPDDEKREALDESICGDIWDYIEAQEEKQKAEEKKAKHEALKKQKEEKAKAEAEKAQAEAEKAKAEAEKAQAEAEKAEQEKKAREEFKKKRLDVSRAATATNGESNSEGRKEDSGFFRKHFGK